MKLSKNHLSRNRRLKMRKKQVKRRPWVKNLYENRDYPDNYTDSKFLEDLRKNLFVEKVTLKQAVLGSFRVVLRVCLCVLYAILFVYMYNEWVKSGTVIVISVFVTCFSYILFIFAKGVSNVFKHLKTVLIYLLIGFLLSPILHTLTDTVSTDTIFAWAVIMNLIHLIFFDYGVSAAIVSNSLSINAAIFGSVCLVSRLNSPFDAFILLTVSVIVFVLSPQLFKVFYNTTLFNVLFVFILSLTLVLLNSVSLTILLYFISLVAFLSLFCPYKFVVWQKYKDNIYGPWDEAVINDSDDLDECLNIEN